MARLIIVPLDGSSLAELALPMAFHVARAWDADVEVVTVHEPVPVPAFGYGLDAMPMEWSEEYVTEILSQIRERVDVSVTSAVLVGSAAEALERHAASREADLVVMTSHGRGMLSAMWLGSVTDRFVRHASCPVLIVRPEEGEEPDLSKEISIDHILIPVDGSEEGDSILPLALDFGKACDSDFALLHVSGATEEYASSFVPYGVRIDPQAMEKERKEAKADIDARVERLSAEGVTVTGHLVLDNSPSHGVLEFASEHGIDLIAMATHGRGPVARLVLGSVTDKVLRGTHLPVLVCRPPGQSVQS